MTFPIAAREYGTKSVILDFVGAQSATVVITPTAGTRIKIAGLLITTDSATGIILLEFDDNREIFRARAANIVPVGFDRLGASAALVTGDVDETVLFTAPANTSIIIEYFELPAVS